MELAGDLIALLTLAGFFAGAIDAIAGGGGLIILPLLFLAGLDPVAAVATNKLQSTFGALASTLSFMRGGHVDLLTHLPLALTALLAAVAGALTVTKVPSDGLQAIMPVLLVVIAIYFAFSRSIRDSAIAARWPVGRFMLLIVPPIAFYDGFFGPGAGSFYVLGVTALLGFAAVPATGLTKYLNFASNLGALILFVVAGKVIWLLGLSMAVGNIAGARVGSLLAMRVGARLIRPLLVLISLAMALRLLIDARNPLRLAVSAWIGA